MWLRAPSSIRLGRLKTQMGFKVRFDPCCIAHVVALSSTSPAKRMETGRNIHHFRGSVFFPPPYAPSTFSSCFIGHCSSSGRRVIGSFHAEATQALLHEFFSRSQSVQGCGMGSGTFSMRGACPTIRWSSRCSLAEQMLVAANESAPRVTGSEGSPDFVDPADVGSFHGCGLSNGFAGTVGLAGLGCSGFVVWDVGVIVSTFWMDQP